MLIIAEIKDDPQQSRKKQHSRGCNKNENAQVAEPIVKKPDQSSNKAHKLKNVPKNFSHCPHLYQYGPMIPPMCRAAGAFLG